MKLRSGRLCAPLLFSVFCFFCSGFVCAEDPELFLSSIEPVVLLQGKGILEEAPHRSGNIYAPDVLIENRLFRMWYGAQGKDGHDRILYAESKDGTSWIRGGIALEDKSANHINDPSVLKVNGIYYLYHTRAKTGVVDTIGVATSKDGLNWKMRGTVIFPGAKHDWDSLLVGRPSVMYENQQFKIWYDGRKDLPLGAPSENVPKSKRSKRSVGYATSDDGITWNKHPAPVFEHNAGGIHVAKFMKHYILVYESHSGTQFASSSDGIHWKNHGLKIRKRKSRIDPHGHVTPFLLIQPDHDQAILFFGAARKSTWNYNQIASIRLTIEELKSITGIKK